MVNKPKLVDVNSYIVYYGNNNLDILSKYDLIIIESKAYTKENIMYLKKKNCIVISYISIIEANHWDKNLKLLDKNDFLLKNNEKQKNTTFNTYLMNISSINWKNILTKKISYIFDYLNFDGLFLDTVGILENTNFTQENKYSLLIETAEFINSIKYRYPQKILIQNNGYLELYHYTKNFIDSICFENLYMLKKNKFEYNYINTMISNILTEKRILPLMLLDKKTCVKYKATYKKVMKIIKANNVLLYISPNEYLEIY
ncbi:MAG: glycoside hydrolase family 66 protein [Clostridiales bacterium]